MTLRKATIINAISKYSVIVMNILFTAIMARMLTPEDYGIIAITTIFTTLFARLSDMGFASAIIQYKSLNEDEINHIYSFTVLIALLLGGGFILAGKPISVFYSNEIYSKLCVILSISVFFNCLNMVPNAVLLRDKKFLQVGIRTVVTNIIGYVSAIVCAVFGGKYYALVLQAVVVSVLDFLYNKYAAKVKIEIHLKISSIKKVWNYSFFQFIFGWVNYLETNLDNILIGGFMGSIPLAYYDKGYKLISYPMNNISGVITPVLHPILKDYQEDKKMIFKKYVDIQKVLSAISLFVVLLFYFFSEEMIHIVYGKQWNDAIIAFQILSFSIYPKILMGTTGAVYCSAGNTKLLFIAGTLNAVVTATGIIIGVLQGSIEAVAVGVSIANWSNMVVTFCILSKGVLKQKIWNFFKEIMSDIIILFSMILIFKVFFEYVNFEESVLAIVGKFCIISCTYLCYLFVCGKMKQIVGIIKK